MCQYRVSIAHICRNFTINPGWQNNRVAWLGKFDLGNDQAAITPLEYINVPDQASMCDLVADLLDEGFRSDPRQYPHSKCSGHSVFEFGTRAADPWPLDGEETFRTHYSYSDLEQSSSVNVTLDNALADKAEPSNITGSQKASLDLEMHAASPSLMAVTGD